MWLEPMEWLSQGVGGQSLESKKMADSLGLWAVNTAVSKHLQGLSGTKRSDWYLKCSLCGCRVKAGGGKLAESGRGVTKKKAVWLPQRWISQVHLGG